MISIIVPVYNTKNCIGKCIESICGQTYSDLDIVIVDDGSTDGTSDLLKEYAKKDKRIRIFTQKNSGQGVARNKGIEQAAGEYIFFADSDDWLEPDAIEALYDSIVANGSDIAVCNFFKTRIDEETVATTIQEAFEGIIYSRCDSNYVFNISSYPFGKLFKKELLDKCNFSFPVHFYEDVSAIPVLLATAEKISFVKEAKYYYRNHSGSTVYAVDKIKDRITCMYSLVENFKKNNCYEKYSRELDEYIVRRIAINVRMMKSAFRQYEKWFIKEQNDFLANNFIDDGRQYKNLKVAAWGSFNSYTISKILMRSDPGEIITDYYGGESIVSLFGKKNSKMNFVNIHAENQFRFNAVKNDFTGSFLHRSIAEFADCDIFIVDFLEERYGIGYYEGNYFTISEAFTSMEKDMGFCFEEISSDEHLRIWKEKAADFAQLLEQYFHDAKIVLLKMKLSEFYGYKGKETLFPNIEQIRRTNHMLDVLYDCFEEICTRAISVDMSKEDFYYTHAEFRHGCHPWHLSQWAYTKIANIIKSLVE